MPSWVWRIAPAPRRLKVSEQKQMNFHEASVVRFCKSDEGIELQLDNVLVGGERRRVILNISPVFSMKIDGEMSSAPLMAADDGEILTLEMSEQAVSLVIEWNDFSNKKSFVRSYQLLGRKVSVLVI